MLLSLFIGEFVSPPLEQIANSNKAVQLSGSTSINSEAGTWRKIGDDYIHINAIAPGGEQLIGVSRYRINQQRELNLPASQSPASMSRRRQEATGAWSM